MRCLLIDNYDSFTWNLADYVAQIFGEKPVVIFNDQYSWEDLKKKISFDCIIVSPGPGSVVNDSDFFVSRYALMQNEIPVLGICLGFQGLAYTYGGQIVHASEVFHGRTSLIYHDASALFEGIPSPFNAVRYHSLMVSNIPDDLLVTAKTKTGIVMALQHKQLPKWGVQFHPESILTDRGKTIIYNFRNLVRTYLNKKVESTGFGGTWGCAEKETAAGAACDCTLFAVKDSRTKKYYIATRKISGKKDPEAIFLSSFAKEDNCFWLDSQDACGEMSRFSFMGSVEKENLYVYNLNPKDLDAGDEFMTLLEKELDSVCIETDNTLPFEFRGGLVGFFTYEMKALFGAGKAFSNTIPDALWMKVNQFLAIDHMTDTIWIVAIVQHEQTSNAASWLNEMDAKIRAVKTPVTPRSMEKEKQLVVNMNMGHHGYLAAIKECQGFIKNGESYEICLTNQFSFDTLLDAMSLYLTLRKENPAPFGAFIKSGNNYVLSTSPERFLKVDSRGEIQVKPIKGTYPRSMDKAVDEYNAHQLSCSEKDRAENLMIVDLMRNDLGRVSIPGTVNVRKLMAIESFKTVHQMVSTIESELKPGKTLIDLIRATFPGGSITGAPKLRTMEIIDKLERAARGVYCGSIGYLGYNRVADLNIAIRTLSYDGNKISIGAGGAITYLSDPEKEFQEIILKAEALLKPLWTYLGTDNGGYNYKLETKQMTIY